MFESILATTTKVTPVEFLICSGISLVLGIVIAAIHCYRNTYSKSMLISLIVIPIVVQAVIMLVNGNIGRGIAIMGAFALVRFRSVAGKAREITSIFLAMTVGLALSMGYVGIAALLVLVVGAVTVILVSLPIGDNMSSIRDLRITIPENLDYEGIFDDLMDKYTSKHELYRVKTVNMGSLFELRYEVRFKKGVSEKAFIDELRCRNGNLTITCGRPVTPKDEL